MNLPPGMSRSSAGRRERSRIPWIAGGTALLVAAAVLFWIFPRRPEPPSAPPPPPPSGPDPAIEAKVMDLFRKIEDLEPKGLIEEALAALDQIAALRPDEPRLAGIRSRLEAKGRQLEAYRKELARAEKAREEAAAGDTPALWQQVAEAAAEAEKLALLEEHRAAARDLASQALQRRDWAAAREAERKGDLDAAIALTAQAIAARGEAPPELVTYKAALERKKRKTGFDRAAAAARAEVDPRRAFELWKEARALADDPRDASEADSRLDALRPRVDPAERERRYEAAMKAGEEALAAGRLEEAEKAFRSARELKGVDLQADQALSRIEAARKKAAYKAALDEAAGAEGRREWRRALEAYDRALRIRPEDPAAAARRREIESVHLPPRISVLLDPTVGLKMEFIRISPGTFRMGDPQGEFDEKPHEVTITRDYWMQATEVTQAQWRAVMGLSKTWSFSGLPTLPAEGVSWEEAQKFIERFNAQAESQIGGRRAGLPTEAEWEYACRAGALSRWSFGGNEAALDDHAWYVRNSGKSPQGVGLKKPNAWGLHDLHGNVAEWCQDWYGPYKGRETDPVGPAEGQYRVLRGGSWNDRAVNTRASRREKDLPSKESLFVGLRLVLR